MRALRLAALGAVLALGACGAPAAGTSSAATVAQSAAGSLVAGYILAANGAAAYIAANPNATGAAAAIRACDDVAWAAIEPISQALAAGQDPTAAEMNAGNAAIAAMSPCLTTAGVTP